MRLFSALLGSLLWIVAGLLGLVSVLLCVTVILAPIGIPLLLLSRKLFAQSIKLVLPRKVTHPAQEGGSFLRKKGKDAKSSMPDTKKLRKKSGKALKQATKNGRKKLAA